jgi:hypothetical protein
VISMKRKGLSQILYLIIAASVLMMIAMVITFTATDIIGGAGGQASTTSCDEALSGKCVTRADDFSVSVPQTCVSEGQFIGIARSQDVYKDTSSSSECNDPPCDEMYMECGDIR